MYLRIPQKLKIKKKNFNYSINKLISFETEIAEEYNGGKIRGPIHLSKGNENHLIKIFSYIDEKDWVFSSWRNHYHALLHGIDPQLIKKFIFDGKSMSISSIKPKFISSSIVGGILPIALGVAKSNKIKKKKERVWCFVGDMTAETGIFHEVYKYSKNFNLKLNFVIEDNLLSTNSPTHIVWNKKKYFDFKKYPDVVYYRYKNSYPHHGTGKWVLF
jgi:pyruvate dehydrogenase E1 component alpha subunit